MTISRETLELAAKACGFNFDPTVEPKKLRLFGCYNSDHSQGGYHFDPLNSAKDREQLAGAIGAVIDYEDGSLVAYKANYFGTFVKNDPTSLGIALCEAAAEVVRRRNV